MYKKDSKQKKKDFQLYPLMDNMFIVFLGPGTEVQIRSKNHENCTCDNIHWLSKSPSQPCCRKCHSIWCNSDICTSTRDFVNNASYVQITSFSFNYSFQVPARMPLPYVWVTWGKYDSWIYLKVMKSYVHKEKTEPNFVKNVVPVMTLLLTPKINLSDKSPHHLPYFLLVFKLVVEPTHFSKVSSTSILI